MASESTHRTLTVERIAPGQFAAVNSRGGRIVFGTGADEEFTPTELLLIAIGGCTAIDIDIITTRRAEPESFEIVVDADKVRDETGNHLANVAVTYRVRFPAGEAGAGRHARRRPAVTRPALHSRPDRRAADADHESHRLALRLARTDRLGELEDVGRIDCRLHELEPGVVGAVIGAPPVSEVGIDVVLVRLAACVPVQRPVAGVQPGVLIVHAAWFTR
jgi:putative redox protein